MFVHLRRMTLWWTQKSVETWLCRPENCSYLITYCIYLCCFIGTSSISNEYVGMGNSIRNVHFGPERLRCWKELQSLRFFLGCYCCHSLNLVGFQVLSSTFVRSWNVQMATTFGPVDSPKPSCSWMSSQMRTSTQPRQYRSMSLEGMSAVCHSTVTVSIQ